MSAVTTHVLDVSVGKPGMGIPVVLERKTHTSGWQAIADGITNADGRVNDFLSTREAFLPGHYRLIFETGPYFLLSNIECFFPQVTISFVVKDPMQHYHVPLLLSPFGYTTYRGS
ncbi:MAG: hydroxyisourate hydrolase [Acidobacteria bacterium]|nr:hydroxyisourate hydrolase [Acidobacteriota bacterium]